MQGKKKHKPVINTNNSMLRTMENSFQDRISLNQTIGSPENDNFEAAMKRTMIGQHQRTIRRLAQSTDFKMSDFN